MSNEQPIRQLMDLLLLDPLYDAEQIVLQRAAMHGLQVRYPFAQLDYHQRPSPTAVDAAVNRIAAIRAHFWQWTDHELYVRLDQIDCREMPELKHAVDRLRAVADSREDLLKLRSALRKNDDFYRSFTETLTLAPREAAGIKEQVMRRLMTLDRRRYQRAARLILRDFPNIYRLEPLWIDEIIAFRNPKAIVGNLTWN